MYPRDLPVLATAPQLPSAMPLLTREYSQPGMSLRQLFSILWAYRKQSFVIAFSVVLVAAALCALWPRTYQATSTLMVNFEVNDPLAGRDFPVGLLGSYMSTQVELARGSEVLLAVIDRLKLNLDKDYISGYSGEAAGLRNWIVTRVRKKLLVEQGRYGSQLIYVTYTASNPLKASQIANAVADVYSEQQYQRLTGPASERAKRYTQQLDDLKIKVVRAQEQVAVFRQQNGLVAADSRMDVDMHAALIQSLKAQLATETTRMAELHPTLGPNHPQVRELQSQIAATRNSLDSETKAYSQKANSELFGAKYQLELQSAQSVYARALDGYDQVMFASSGGYSNVSFVSRATPPPQPSSPKTMIVMLLACVLGAGLGISIPMGYEFFNRRVRCSDDVERDHGIPVLIELGPIGFLPYENGRGSA